MKPTWLISSLAPARRDSLGRYSCSLTSERKAASETIAYKISQETLAEMIGSTRARVNFFMNKFKKLGFIEYNGGLQINPSLMTIIVHD